MRLNSFMNKLLSTVLFVAIGGLVIWLFAFHITDEQLPRTVRLAIGGTVLLTLVPFLYSSRVTQAMRQLGGKTDPRYADAPMGIGTLRHIQRTKLSINDIPQYQLTFDVQTPNGLQFTSRTHLLLMANELVRFTVGSRLPVCYLPDRLDHVEIAPASRAEEASAVAHAISVQQGTGDPEALEIARYGQRSTGVVLITAPTGEVRDGQTAMMITVRIKRPEGTYFDATKTIFVMPTMLAGLQVGSQVEVTYLPYDESRFILTMWA